MSGLMRLRDTLAVMGQADARALSLRLLLTQAMIAAMLERLEMMGQVERVTGDEDRRASACRACLRSDRCRLPYYRLRVPTLVTPELASLSSESSLTHPLPGGVSIQGSPFKHYSRILHLVFIVVWLVFLLILSTFCSDYEYT